MLTIKKRGPNIKALWVLALALFVTACDPPGNRAMNKGEKLMSQGKYPEAAAKFEESTRLLTEAPLTVQALAWDWLGVARQSLGKAREAAEAYEMALKLDRNLAPARYNLGSLYLDYANYKLAIDQFNTCLALPRPPEIRDTDVYLKIGTAYLRLAGQTSGAERIRLLDRARLYFNEVHKMAPCAEEANAIGMIVLQRSRSASEAVTHFKEALRLDPNFTPAMLNLAIVHHHYLNEPRVALEEYRAYVAATEAPPRVKPVGTNDVEAVIRALENQLQPPRNTPQPPAAIAPTNAPAKPAAIKAESDTVQTAKAPQTQTNSPKVQVEEPKPTRVALTNVPSPAPTNSQPQLARSPTNSITNPDAGKPAPTPLRYRYLASTPMAAGNPNEAARLIAQGYTAQQQKNLAEAIPAYQRATKADPRCYDAYYLLGAAARETGNLSVALDALERAVALKPDSADARYAFAWTLQKSKFPQDAADELEKLLKQSPNDTRAHLLLGNIYSQDLKQPKSAREHYQKVVELEPNHPQAASIREWLKTAPAEG